MLTNWKTSLAGFVLAFAQWFYTSDGSFTWKGFIVALPTLLLGLWAKDPAKK